MLLPAWLSVIGLVVPIAPIESPMRISAMAFSGEATGPFPLRAAAAARCCCCFLRLSASLWAFFCASVFVALRVLRYLFKFTFALFFRTGRTAISAAPATFCWQRCCGKDHRRMITRNGAKCQRQGIDGRVRHQKQHRFLRSSRQGHSTVLLSAAGGAQKLCGRGEPWQHGLILQWSPAAPAAGPYAQRGQ